jgi:hypothetical protein
MKVVLQTVLIFFLTSLSLTAGVTLGGKYIIEDINMPEGVPPEVGALAIKGDTLYIALRRGDIIYSKIKKDPNAFDWKRFASGFHNPCGMEFDAKGRLFVSQMGELNRLTDTDGDGKADLYEAVAHWGLSGNYHETVEMCPDGQGGLYLAIGTASHNGPTFKWVKGKYSKVGRRGRNFSSVQWRGWVMHYTKDGELKPFASGFRMHNGISLDQHGNIWCGDNQGDWKGTTPLYHVEKGKFYGHPSSLVWTPNWDKSVDPLKMGLSKINAMRTMPAVQIPHKAQIRSAAEPITFPSTGKFGDFKNQMLISDNNGARFARVMLEKVNGQYQGATTLFLDGLPLKTGNNRVIFSPDQKSMFTGQTIRGWGKRSEGLQRITYTGSMPFEVHTMSLTKKGFRLTFTEAPNDLAKQVSTYKMSSYHYEDKWLYGSPQHDKKDHVVKKVKEIDDKTFEIEIEGLKAGKIFDLSIQEALNDSKDNTLKGRSYCYTVNQMRK